MAKNNTKEGLNYWLEKEQHEKLKKIQQIMQVVNNPGCQTILYSLNGNSNRNCAEIHLNGLEKNLVPRGYQNLKKLENLNFVTKTYIDGVKNFSLNYDLLIDFAECIRLYVPNESKLVQINHECLEIAYKEGSSTMKYLLDFTQTNSILSAINCLLNEKLKTILKYISNNENCEDQIIQFATGFKQSTLSRNLTTFANCNLIKRVKDNRYRINSVNHDYISCLSAFFKVIVRTKFEKYEPKERWKKPRKVFLKKSL